jgi:hypothetical protein
MTFIYHKSDNFEVKLKENDEKIIVIQQFFIPDNKERYDELKQTLKFNLNNKNIDKIYLLNEKIYSDYELGLTDVEKLSIDLFKKDVYKKKVNDKITQINMKKRLTFKQALDFVKGDSIKGYIVILNTDIFLDNTIRNLRKTTFDKEKGMFSLLRWEFTNKNLNKCKLFGHKMPGRGDSQDSWILHSNFIPKNTKAFDIEFGVPGCDNKIAYLFLIHGFKVVNNPFFIKTYHNHKTLTRNYKEKLETPYAMLVASRTNAEYINIPQYTGLHQVVKDIHGYTDKFNKMVYRDNDVFIGYLEGKIKRNENFIIPRVAGIENYVAYKTMVINSNLDNLLTDCLFEKKSLSMNDREKIETEIKYSNLKQVLHTMKNNAGIKIVDSQTLMKYAYQYLQAFDYSEMFFSWGKWGNVNQNQVGESIDYVEKRFGKTRKVIDSLVLDIFHYIHKPWTHTLKGKKILIISPFVDSFKEKEKNRKHIYGVDLFPDCEFVYLKPPQTQGQTESKPFDYELMVFIKKLEELEFDVALCSCGGYGNLVVNYIYNMGKSAIYVGGVLQMYFGVYGERWLRERKEVMKMYKNKHWSRPKELEKPKGFEQVEGSAYW